MKTMSQIASGLYKSLTEADKKKPKPYDTKAEVTRIEDDIVWVKFPGGEDETPVLKTNNATPGDQVMVRVSGGKAWVLGNETSPATDDTRANYAVEQSNEAFDAAKVSQEAADIAQNSANKAISSASLAETSANEARNNASTAAEAAQNAIINSQSASMSASTANASANSATYHLSEIEKVIDAISWISEHGEYIATNDTYIINGKWYFERIEDSKYIVGSPTSNPHDEGFYELQNVDSAITNYINTHIYLDNDGLYVRMDKDNGSKIRITGTGIYFLNEQGVEIAQYGGSIVLGNSDGTHIEISPTYGLSFYQTRKVEDQYGVPTNRVAYIQNDRLFIESATLTNSLQIGNFIWVVLDHRISLKYNPI